MAKAVFCAAVLAGSAVAMPAAAATKTFENAEQRYVVALPEACTHVAGPGTLEAICSPDLDAGKSAGLVAATAFLLEVDSEPVPADAPELTEAEFRQEIPDQVCGEADATKVQLTSVGSRAEVAGANFSADVVCPEVRFLRLPERRAQVRYRTAKGMRYRLLARAPAGDWDKVKDVADAFFASFKTTPQKSP